MNFRKRLKVCLLLSPWLIVVLCQGYIAFHIEELWAKTLTPLNFVFIGFLGFAISTKLSGRIHRWLFLIIAIAAALVFAFFMVFAKVSLAVAYYAFLLLSFLWFEEFAYVIVKYRVNDSSDSSNWYKRWENILSGITSFIVAMILFILIFLSKHETTKATYAYGVYILMIFGLFQCLYGAYFKSKWGTESQ